MSATPHTAEGRRGLAAIRERPGDAVIGLDFDGTLSPIVADPAAARAHPDAAAVLTRLAAKVGAVVIITGRPAAIAVEYGGVGEVPGLVVLGQYGRERWEAGTLTVPEPPPGVQQAREKLPKVLETAGAPAGVHIEDKGHALAVHTRRCAEPQVVLERLRGLVEALAERSGLVVEPGRLVLELRAPGIDKGTALRGFLAERRPASAVLFAGDDLGDLAAFQAVAELRDDGVPGVMVCSGSPEVRELTERADLIVDGPDGVVELLADLADTMR